MKYDVSKIRELISTTGINETDFLHSVGLSSWTLIRWEIGTELPREDFASYIASRLGVSLSDICWSGSSKDITPCSKKLLAETFSNICYVPISKVSLKKDIRPAKPSVAKIKQVTDHYREYRELDKPVVVSRNENGYILEDKYLRYYVAQRLQLKSIPVLIVDPKKMNEKEETKPKTSPGFSKTVVEPSSTILVGKLRLLGDDRIIDIYVVSDSHEQDTANGVFWVGRTLPSILLLAIQLKEKTVFL